MANTNNHQRPNQTRGAYAVDGSAQIPAYILARKKFEDDADEKDRAAAKAAFIRAHGGPEMDGAGNDKSKPVMPGSKKDAETAHDGNAPAENFKFNIRGTGWRKMRDENGKVHRVRDDGHSIYIPGNPSPTQMKLVAMIANEKGWESVAVYKRGSNKLHKEATQYLASMIGGRCVTDQSHAGKFRDAVECGVQHEKGRLLAEHRQKLSQSPKPPAHSPA